MKELSHFSDYKSNIKWISIVALVLLLVQVVSLFMVFINQKTEQYNYYTSEEFGKSVVSLNNVIDYTKQTAISTASIYEVFRMMFSSDISRADEQNFRYKTDSIISNIYFDIKDVFVYNGARETIYTREFLSKKIEELPESYTKQMILNGKNEENNISIFSDKSIFLKSSVVKDEVLRVKLITNRKDNSCIVFDLSMETIQEIFEEFRNKFSGHIFILNSNGDVMLSSNKDLEESLIKDLPYLSRADFSNAVLRNFNGQKYLVLGEYSNQIRSTVYCLIPASQIKMDYQQTKTILAVTLSIIIVVCLLLIMPFFFKYLLDITKESARRQQLVRQEKMREQFMRRKKHISNCLWRPSEQDIRMAKEYVDGMVLDSDAVAIQMDWKELAILRVDLWRYKVYQQNNPSVDVMLFKYGMVNICEEILNGFLKVSAIYERDETIIFVVVSCEDYIKRCYNAYLKCREAILQYAGEEVSFFLSRSGKIEELPELNMQVEKLAEYQFLLNGSGFMDYQYPNQLEPMETDLMMKRIDLVCEHIGQVEICKQELMEFFKDVQGLRIDDAKNALWILLFKLFNSEHRLKEQGITIGETAAYFNYIDSLDDMQKFFMEILESIWEYKDTKEKARQNYQVQRVIEIIEKRFKDPELCADQIADELRLSKAYLLRKFKSSMRMSISEALNERRMEEMSRLLIETDKSLKLIITEIGGLNHNYYMVMFKKKFNMTPTEYRLNYKI